MTGLEVLDPCCGSKMFWFDPNIETVCYADCRNEEHTLCDGRVLKVEPDHIIDFRKMPFKNKSFNLVVFDPPHLNKLGKNSWMAKKYGILGKDWKNDLKKGFAECWRVLDYGGTMIFKWNETQIKISEILKCFPAKPFFGQRVTRNLKTMWIVFYKERSVKND
jgi:DNA modification methylase